MKKIFAFILIVFVAVIADAKTPGLVFGYGDSAARPYAYVGDSYQFNANDGGRYEVYRYGFSQGQMMLGLENALMEGRAHNGLTVKGLNGNSGITSHIGVGLFNMEGRVNTNHYYKDYYMWQPSVDLGVQSAIEDSIVLTADVKLGGSVTNYYTHDAENAWLSGYVINITLFSYSFGLEHTTVNGRDRDLMATTLANKYMFSTTVDNLNRETNIGIREEF